MTLLVMKRSHFLFFVCLLLILIPLLQAAASPGLVAENLERVDFDDLPTATSKSQQTRHTDQELTGKALKSDCLEELPARMQLWLSDLPVLNADIRLSLVVIPEADAQNTRIRIILPEGLSLSKGSLQWYGDLLKNHEVRMDVFIRAEAAGTWRIEAIAESNPQTGFAKTCSTQCYAQVTEEETSILGIVPDCFGEIDASRMDSFRSSGLLGPLSGMTTVYGYWYYLNENGNPVPTRFARVELWKYNVSGDVLLATTFVQGDGHYEFPAVDNVGSLDVYVKLFCHTHQYEIVKVVNSDNVIFWSQTSVCHNVTGEYLDVGSWTVEGEQRECWEIYDDVVDGYFWLLNKTGWSRSEIYARITSGYAGSISLGDGIIIYPGDGWNRDTVLHEYGHCINYAARGGSFPPSNREEDEHYPDTESDGGWAFREGWAEFFPCAVDNTTFMCGGGYGSIERTTYADNPFGHGDYGDWDGGVVEGAVAQVFWDMYDGTSSGDCPPWDEIQHGDYVLSQFDKLWNIFLNNDPNNMNAFWLLWDSKDADMWAVFRHARIYKPRNIVVTDILPTQGTAILGGTAAINVTVRNLNGMKEKLTLTVFASSQQIALIENTELEEYASHNYTIGWNTTGFVRGDYTLSAHAEVLPQDLNETDNTLSSSVVTLVSPGHDICLEEVIMLRTLNGLGFSWSIEIDVRNFGSFPEVFNVAINANSTEIGAFSNISLASGGAEMSAMVWNTTSFLKGNYTVTIYASCVPEETNIVDNTASNWVFVTILGDVDGDFNVDIIDVVRIAVAYGVSSEDPQYTLCVDLNNDGRITILDIVLCTSHYGDAYP